MKCKVLIRISSVKKILFIKKNYMLLCSEFNHLYGLYYVKINRSALMEHNGHSFIT
jgi:hypothetical protein